jgi:hypothetical protein
MITPEVLTTTLLSCDLLSVYYSLPAHTLHVLKITATFIDPEICSSYRLPQDLAKAKKEDWYYSQTIDPKPMMAHCSPESVAFHHLSPQMIVDTDALWYKCNGELP